MIELNTSFPGAAAENLRVQDGQVRFSAPKHDASVSMWWHFGLDLDACDTIECVWEKTDEVLGGGGLAAAVPVYHDGLRWRRVRSRLCRYDPERNEFHFRVPCRKPHVQIAYCFPYGWPQINAFIDELADAGLVNVRRIGESRGGRPFQLLEFGHGSAHVWVTARHHAGETPGSYVLEGLVRAALRQPGLLGAFTFHVVPVMDVDGVAEGRYGKNSAPHDHNRDYLAQPVHPEVAALMAAASWAKRADIFIDLHAPCPGDHSFAVPISESLASTDYWSRVWQFAQCLEAFAPAGCPARVADWPRDSMNWCGEDLMQQSTAYFFLNHAALALSLETTYHRNHNGRLASYRGWLGLGKALAATLAVAAGIRPAPAVLGADKPPLTVPHFQNWWCVHVPADVALAERPASLEITSTGSQSYCWIMHKQVLNSPARRATLVYRLEGSVQRCTVTAKGWDRQKGLPTGTWTSEPIALNPGQDWQTDSFAHDERDFLLMVRVEGLEGRLELRPPVQG